MFATIQFRIFLSACLSFENQNIKIMKTIILPVVLSGCET